ncbi:MAG TPA: dethiobiotin synthase [Verrucomicrobium sp.]|nr:dethiobiotin synthase [Verrucomicrobium sp.]
MNLFITGTDTDAGKTYVTRLLLDALKQGGIAAAGFKPFCCGGRQDSILLHQGSAEGPGFTLDEINPVWLKTPASPFTAALIENRKLDFPALHRSLENLTSRVDHVLIEGAGGWEVPLAPGYTLADFAQEIGWPVLVVVNNKLGALNHTILTVKNILARGLTCAGLVLNYAKEERDAVSISNRMVLETMDLAPVVADIMHGETDGRELLDGLSEWL